MTLYAATLTSQLKEMNSRELYYALDKELRFHTRYSRISGNNAETSRQFQEELQIFVAEYYERGLEIDFFRIVKNFAMNYKLSSCFVFGSMFYKGIAKAFANAIYWSKAGSDEYRKLISLLTGVHWFIADTTDYASDSLPEYNFSEDSDGQKYCWYLPDEALSSYHRELLDSYLENLMPHELLSTTPALASILREFYTRRIMLSNQCKSGSPISMVYFTSYHKAKLTIIQRAKNTVEKIREIPSYYPMVKSLNDKVLDVFGLNDRL